MFIRDGKHLRVLLVTQWYIPEPARLISGFAEGLVKTGCDVTVLTGFPNYPAGRIYPGYRLRLWQKEVKGGVKIIRVPLYPNHDKSGLKRVLNYLSFAISASLLGPLLTRRPNVVHAYHPPLTTLWPAWVLSCLYWVPLTVEIQDLWPETLRATGMVRNLYILSAVGWVAKWFYRRAACIRVISQGFARNLVAKGVSPGKVRVIPNWTDIIGRKCPDRALSRSLGLAGHFNIMFAGNVGLAQDLDNMLEAAHLLRDMSELQFVVVGDGADSERLQDVKRDRGLGNVAFLGRYPSESMPEILALADVLLVHLGADPLFEITIPHKVYTYMANGKPILVVGRGDVAETVRAVGAGVSCEPGNPSALAAAVRRMSEMSNTERNKMGENGRLAAESLYSREKIVRQLESMMIRAVRRRTRSGAK